MNKKIIAFGLSLLLVLSMAPGVMAKEATSSSRVEAGETISLKEGEVVLNDYFGGGSSVDIAGEVQGELALAGGVIDVSGKVAEDFLAAGGTLIFSGEVDEDARLAGGQVHISGDFGGDLWVFGGTVTISEETVVKGNVLMAGGVLNFKGKTEGNLMAYGGEVTLGGEVAGNVTLEGDVLTILEGVVVDGDLKFGYGSEKSVASDLVVGGEVEEHLLKEKYPDWKMSSFNGESLIQGFLLGQFIFSFLSVLLVGTLMMIVFKKGMKKVSVKIDKDFGLVFLVGFLFFPVMFFGIIFLFFTLFGIPLALLLVVAMVCLIYLAKIWVSVWLGGKVLELLKMKSNLWPSLALGLLIYQVIARIPVLGFFAVVFLLCLGLGGVILTLNEAREK